jgi:hypothetical protein
MLWASHLKVIPIHIQLTKKHKAHVVLVDEYLLHLDTLQKISRFQELIAQAVLNGGLGHEWWTYIDEVLGVPHKFINVKINERNYMARSFVHSKVGGTLMTPRRILLRKEGLLWVD